MESREGVEFPESTYTCGHVRKFEKSVGVGVGPDTRVGVVCGGSPPTWVTVPGEPEPFSRNPIDPSLTTSESMGLITDLTPNQRFPVQENRCV